MIKLPLTAAAAAALLVATTAFAEEEAVVNVYNWSDYIDEDILTEFEAETGIKVVYDVFDSNEHSRNQTARRQQPDTMSWCRAGFSSSRQVQAGVFKKLDKSQASPTSKQHVGRGRIKSHVESVRSRQRILHQLHVGNDGLSATTSKRSQGTHRQGRRSPAHGTCSSKPSKYSKKFADCGVLRARCSRTEIIPAVPSIIIGDRPGQPRNATTSSQGRAE